MSPAASCSRSTTRTSGRFGERLSGRVAELREAWDQMTFYVLDPESWR